MTKSVTKYKFAVGSKVVYPSHGVGEIKGVEKQVIAGTQIDTYVVTFEREKMTLRIPIARAENAGLRPLATNDDIKKIDSTLSTRAKTSRGMWSRRAKEYEAKINSGNVVSVAEVVRDLHKNVDDPDRSYSERIIYESALDRLAGEVSAVKKIDVTAATAYLVKIINDNAPKKIKPKDLEEVEIDEEFEEELAA
jgi:CarD family transcriptional regulator